VRIASTVLGVLNYQKGSRRLSESILEALRESCSLTSLSSLNLKLSYLPEVPNPGEVDSINGTSWQNSPHLNTGSLATVRVCWWYR
jgi:hypothetical protein